MTNLNILYALNAFLFVFLMVLITCLSHWKRSSVLVLQREGFCTCRGAQYNNSSADVNQANCYKNKIPPHIWKQSHAGCTCVSDPGQLSYNYNVLQKQLPEFAGV